MKIKIYSTLFGALMTGALVQDATASTWQMCGSTKVKWASESVTLRAHSGGFTIRKKNRLYSDTSTKAEAAVSA